MIGDALIVIQKKRIPLVKLLKLVETARRLFIVAKNVKKCIGKMSIDAIVTLG
jgi:hypothetical protein